MAASPEADISEAQIAVHWKEEPLINPPASFVAQANMNDKRILERFSERNFPQCYEEYANMLTWDQKWQKVLDTSKPPFWKWFVGGKLNASYNCIDRHLSKYKNKAAIVWVPDLPKTRSGKIMRRVLASISDRKDYGDVTTLANPDIVETIRKQVQVA